jgi:DNA-binding transcriptional regulator YhcF (GntR family)
MRANNADGAPSAEQVYNAIYHYVSHWNIAPTIRELAEDLNCGHSTVQRRIIELEKSGSITIHGKKSRGIVIKGQK